MVIVDTFKDTLKDTVAQFSDGNEDDDDCYDKHLDKRRKQSLYIKSF